MCVCLCMQVRFGVYMCYNYPCELQRYRPTPYSPLTEALKDQDLEPPPVVVTFDLVKFIYLDIFFIDIYRVKVAIC